MAAKIGAQPLQGRRADWPRARMSGTCPPSVESLRKAIKLGKSMAETFGSLCDKLTIIKLKQWHSDDAASLQSLNNQERQLTAEIDDYVRLAVSGGIPREQLTFAANKIYKKEGNRVTAATGGIGEIFAQLAHVNCALWHQQEKVYEFEKVPAAEKDQVVKQLALLNLERNQCIDGINKRFVALIANADNTRK